MTAVDERAATDCFGSLEVPDVVSKDSPDREYRLKRSMYAAGRVPAHLIVDPLAGRCVLLTEPHGSGDAADYRTERTSKFGETVPLDVLGITPETEEFETMS